MTSRRPSESDATKRLLAGERWYAVQTLAKREFGALIELEAQNFRAFCPHVMRNVRHARRTRTVKAAFFPGYLFVAFNAERHRWRSINGTFGVARLVSAGHTGPLPVPEGVVEGLLDYVDETGICRFERDLAVGQSVRVVAGPLAQMIGKLVRLDPNGRVRVLMEILGGQIYATMEKSALEARLISAHPPSETAKGRAATGDAVSTQRR